MCAFFLVSLRYPKTAPPQVDAEVAKCGVAGVASTATEMLALMLSHTAHVYPDVFEACAVPLLTDDNAGAIVERHLNFNEEGSMANVAMKALAKMNSVAFPVVDHLCVKKRPDDDMVGEADAEMLVKRFIAYLYYCLLPTEVGCSQDADHFLLQIDAIADALKGNPDVDAALREAVVAVDVPRATLPLGQIAAKMNVAGIEGNPIATILSAKVNIVVLTDEEEDDRKKTAGAYDLLKEACAEGATGGSTFSDWRLGDARLALGVLEHTDAQATPAAEAFLSKAVEEGRVVPWDFSAEEVEHLRRHYGSREGGNAYGEWRMFVEVNAGNAAAQRRALVCA